MTIDDKSIQGSVHSGMNLNLMSALAALDLINVFVPNVSKKSLFNCSTLEIIGTAKLDLLFQGNVVST